MADPNAPVVIRADVPATDPPAAKNWFDRLAPTARAWIVGAVVLAVNAGLSLLWGKVFPGTLPPQVQPVPQQQPSVLVFSFGQAPTTTPPVNVSGK